MNEKYITRTLLCRPSNYLFFSVFICVFLLLAERCNCIAKFRYSHKMLSVMMMMMMMMMMMTTMMVYGLDLGLTNSVLGFGLGFDDLGLATADPEYISANNYIIFRCVQL